MAQQLGAFPGGLVIRKPPIKQETWGSILDWEDLLEKGMANSGRLAQPCFWHFGGQRALDHLLGWEREGSTNCTLET